MYVREKLEYHIYDIKDTIVKAWIELSKNIR